MPGEVSRSYEGPADHVPFPPRWAYPHLSDAAYAKLCDGPQPKLSRIAKAHAGTVKITLTTREARAVAAALDDASKLAPEGSRHKDWTAGIAMKIRAAAKPPKRKEGK